MTSHRWRQEEEQLPGEASGTAWLSLFISQVSVTSRVCSNTFLNTIHLDLYPAAVACCSAVEYEKCLNTTRFRHSLIRFGKRVSHVKQRNVIDADKVFVNKTKRLSWNGLTVS